MSVLEQGHSTDSFPAPQPRESRRSSLWRSRWAAFGAAVAVSIGGGGVFLAGAAGPGPNESTIVSVTPTRILDTRDPVNLGLPGPFTSPASQKLQVTGSVPTAGGTAVVVPVGATGVLLNVTAVSPNAAGFVSIRPGDAVGAPTTSSLNVEAGSNVPNAVQVALPTAGPDAGKIDITYDAYGVAGRTTELLVDVVGYTTNTGLQQLMPIKTVLAYSGSNTEAAPAATFTLIRTVGVFTKQRADSALHLEWSSHHLGTAGNFCHYQLRIDGRANDGDDATGYQVDQEGNAVSYAAYDSLSTFAEFPGVAAGNHTVQVWVRGGGTACTLNFGNFNQQVLVEEYAAATGSAFDVPAPASADEAVLGGQ